MLCCQSFPSKEQAFLNIMASPSAEILEPKKIKSVSVAIVSSSVYHEVMGLDARILVF